MSHRASERIVIYTGSDLNLETMVQCAYNDPREHPVFQESSESEEYSTEDCNSCDIPQEQRAIVKRSLSSVHVDPSHNGQSNPETKPPIRCQLFSGLATVLLTVP